MIGLDWLFIGSILAIATVLLWSLTGRNNTRPPAL